MTITSPSPAWNPKLDSARHADTTANIHRAIAWIYGVIGVLFAGIAASVSGATAAGVIALIIGAIVALHAALAAGARNRNDVAKVGSVIVGVLMLAGFPIGTIVGGYLIYNAVQDWPPRRHPQTAPGAVAVDLRDL